MSRPILDVPWARTGLLFPDDNGLPPGVTKINGKDLWTGNTTTVSLGAQGQGLAAKGVPAHGTGAYRLSHPTPGETLRTWPTGMIFNTYSLHCLTDSDANNNNDGSAVVTWANCTAADSQVWRVRPDGRVSSLANPGGCLAVDAAGAVVTSTGGGDVNSSSRSSSSSSADSSEAYDGNRWDYFLSGNLVQASSGLCLTEDGPVATARECGYLTNEQVVALPVGVPV